MGVIMKNGVAYGGGLNTDNSIIISNSQPSSSDNKLWINTDVGSGASYQVPTVAEMQAADTLCAKADEIGIVIDGNSTSVGAAIGNYVFVKNSTISGITDGLYTAEKVIPANTAIDSTYLTAVSGGGLNDLKSKLLWINPNPESSFAPQTIQVDLSDYDLFAVIYSTSAVLSNPRTVTYLHYKGTPTLAMAIWSFKIVYRLVQASNDSSIEFSDGGTTDTYGTPVTDQTKCVPMYIYGIK